MYVYQDRVSSPQKKLENLMFDWTGKTVVELGCNIGKLGLYVLDYGAKSYRGIDIDENMVKIGNERYGLGLEVMNVLDIDKPIKSDVVVAMALFHHIKDDSLELLFKMIQSRELIFEVPVGQNDVGLYQTRPDEYYRSLVERNYGEVIEVIESGATNDPHNERIIYYCKRNG